MDDLKGMAVFFHVVDAGSFSAAARRLEMSKSAVSKQVAHLERHLGVRLVHRSTRRLGLTEAGEVFFRSCARIVGEADHARRQLGQQGEAITGTLRVSCPVAFGDRFVTPLVTEFAALHPGLNLELLIDDRVLDVIEERIDVAIRIGWLEDSQLIARRLLDSPRVLCASPGYLGRHGIPEQPRDLAHHQWIILSLLPTPYRQTLSAGGETCTVHVSGRFRTNSTLALRSLLLAGAGIGVLAEFLVGEDIRQGRLVRLLPAWDVGDAGIYAVYRDREYMPAKTRVFIDFLATRLQPGRDLDGARGRTG